MHLQTQFGEDRCTQFRVIVVTDTARPPARLPAVRNPQTGPITIHASAQCKKNNVMFRVKRTKVNYTGSVRRCPQVRNLAEKDAAAALLLCCARRTTKALLVLLCTCHYCTFTVIVECFMDE